VRLEHARSTPSKVAVVVAAVIAAAVGVGAAVELLQCL
jgi:hypothetical protein